MLHTTNFLLNTGAQLNLVARSFPPASLIGEGRKEHKLNSSCTKSDPIITAGQMELYLLLGGFLVNTMFNVVETLSVNSLIGTYFKDRYVTVNYPTETRLKILRSRFIAIV